MYSTGKLYEVEKSGQGKAGDTIPIRIISAVAPSIIIYGAEETPVSVAVMQDIASGDSPFIVADYYNFASLPRFIAFIGTADDIQVSNVRLKLIGDIS